MASAAPKPEVRLTQHQPCNVFSPDAAVSFPGQLIGFSGGKAEITATAVDYSGSPAGAKTFTINVAPQGVTNFDFAMGKLPIGYYEIVTKAVGQDADGAPLLVERKTSLGVTPFVSRSAKEVRDGGYVFGLKWGPGVPDARAGMDLMVKLGLQWTRVIQNQKAPLTTNQMLTEFPMNAIIKVERFPKELYDEQRYGPLEEWEKKYGKGAWTLKSLPQKEKYQALLHDELAANIPVDQNVFEIWNEPWDKMSPEDFATLSQWIVEVILRDRPNAVIGPNLAGNTSEYEYDAKVIAAGGLKGMKMVALHPYAASEDREWLRSYRQWLKQKTGREMDIYITEYGSHSTPEGPAFRSEPEQARRVARQSLALYAEGVKAMTPHWIGQSEQNRTYVEDWFGFIRKNGEAKPVLMAHATAARLIDSSRFVGDLWYGPRVAAMLFERKGEYTLALWTLRDTGAPETSPAKKEIEVTLGVDKAIMVDMVGKESKPVVSAGKMKLTLTDAPVYLVGVSPELAKQASRELRSDRWPAPEKAPRNVRVAHHMAAVPAFDGQFQDWKGATQIEVVNPKVAGADCSGTAYVGWNEEFLFVGLDIRDNEMLNTEPRAKLYLQDSVELFLSMEPRETGSGYGPRDHQFLMTPSSGEGRPIFAELTDREAGKLADVSGAKFFAGKTTLGWAIEAAIPWASFPGFKPEPGVKAALELRVNDADTSHPRFKLDPGDIPVLNVSNPSSWSLLLLQ